MLVIASLASIAAVIVCVLLAETGLVPVLLPPNNPILLNAVDVNDIVLPIFAV